MPDPPPESTALAVTWDDVLKPGQAGDITLRGDPFAVIPSPQFETGTFSLDNACFLAAQSLLIYRKYSDTDAGDNAPVFPGRHAVLARLGFEETYTGEIAGTVCSIIESEREAASNSPVALVFRGTSHLKNWLTNIQSIPSQWPGGGHVHGGFAEAHEEIWDHLGPRIAGFVSAGRPIFITGHSLGGALATLTLSRIIERHSSAAGACAYTFGSPRVGNEKFASSMEGAPLHRVVNNQDLVTRLPLAFPLSRRLSFLHAGNAYFLDPSSRLEARGSGDLEEEATGLNQIKELLRHASNAFTLSRPPSFLADHAPPRYLEKLQRANGGM